MPQFFCVHCGQSIEADDALVGIQTTCPVCEGLITVPAAPPYAGVVPLPSSPPSFIRSSQRFEWVNEPAMADLEPPRYSWLWPTLATVFAAALTFVGYRTNMSRDVDPRDFYEVPVARMAFQYLESFIAVSLVGVVIALVVALLRSPKKRELMGLLWQSYNFVVLALGLGALIAGLLTAGDGIPGVDPYFLNGEPVRDLDLTRIQKRDQIKEQKDRGHPGGVQRARDAEKKHSADDPGLSGF